MKTYTSVEPVGDQWGVFEYKNVFTYIWHSFRKYGISITLYNIWFLIRS